MDNPVGIPWFVRDSSSFYKNVRKSDRIDGDDGYDGICL